MIYLKKKLKWFKKVLWLVNYLLGVFKIFGKVFFNYNLLFSK